MRPVHPASANVGFAIGAKLRSVRQAQGLTIAQVADATDLTKGYISRIERDETSPSVSTLLSICQVLSLTIGTLFEVPDNKVIPLHEAPFINMGGSGAVERLISPRHESRVQVLRSVLAPGASGGDDFYAINCDIEVIHVLDGQMDLIFPSGTVTLRVLDTMTLAGREPHTWRNSNDGESRVIWTLIPAPWSRV